ncbi:MAG: hypothetical protein LBT58_00670 [Endomicrobium sp.]|jgi:hypothetical protein|nr:hypothetical protein [Endomicrobium sp.]
MLVSNIQDNIPISAEIILAGNVELGSCGLARCLRISLILLEVSLSVDKFLSHNRVDIRFINLETRRLSLPSTVII